MRHEVKEMILAGMDNSDLVLLKFSKQSAKKNLDWEHSREFEYQGDMYDVVRSESTIDSVSYWCWKDEKESKLNKSISSLVNKVMNQHSQDQQQAAKLMVFIQNLYLDGAFSWTPKTIIDPLVFFHKNTTGFNQTNLVPPFPPPISHPSSLGC